jgi:hypothetical protein
MGSQTGPVLASPVWLLGDSHDTPSPNMRALISMREKNIS